MEFNVRVPHIDEIKAHIKKHKTEYAVGTAVVITAGVTYLVTRRLVVQPISVAPVFNNIPTFNNNGSNNVNFGGHATKIVKRLSDDKVWEKITYAAEEAGVTPSYMSRHLHGHNHFPDVHGEMYKIVGVGTTG